MRTDCALSGQCPKKAKRTNFVGAGLEKCLLKIRQLIAHPQHNLDIVHSVRTLLTIMAERYISLYNTRSSKLGHPYMMNKFTLCDPAVLYIRLSQMIYNTENSGTFPDFTNEADYANDD